MATRGNSKARTEVLDMLKEDHQKVKKAFRDAQKIDAEEDPESLQEIVEQTCAELEVHAQLEEQVFYPAVREGIDEQEIVEEAEIEHGSAKALIAQLRELEPTDPKYSAAFKVLGEYVKHHIKEEEGEMFEQLNRTKIQWEPLLQEMQQAKAQLMEQMGLGEEETEAAEAPAESSRSSRSRGSSGRRRSQTSQEAEEEETVE